MENLHLIIYYWGQFLPVFEVILHHVSSIVLILTFYIVNLLTLILKGDFLSDAFISAVNNNLKNFQVLSWNI